MELSGVFSDDNLKVSIYNENIKRRLGESL